MSDKVLSAEEIAEIKRQATPHDTDDNDRVCARCGEHVYVQDGMEFNPGDMCWECNTALAAYVLPLCGSNEVFRKALDLISRNAACWSPNHVSRVAQEALGTPSYEVKEFK